MKKFEFFLWNYMAADKYYASAECLADEWLELGITLGFSPYFEEGHDISRNFLSELIAACEKRGIDLIIFDKRVFWLNYLAVGTEAYVAAVRAALKDFGGSRAVRGFYIGDEPEKDQFAPMGEALKIYKGLTDKVGFVNFSRNDALDRSFGIPRAYAAELKAFAGYGLDYMANDRYSQLHAKDYVTGFAESGIDKYFRDLNFFRNVAAECALPYIVSLSCVGHWMYRTPSEDDIRWQLNTAIAHGADGIQWFFIHQHRFADDYYSYPVDIYGNRSAVFGYIARQTRLTKDTILRELEGCTFSRVWHIGKNYGDTPLLGKNDAAYFVRADHGMNGIFSEFSGKNGKKYLVINGDQKYPELFWIQGNDREKYHVWLPPGGAHIVRD